MSNFEDDEALFDDVYAEDTKVSTNAPTVTEQQQQQEQPQEVQTRKETQESSHTVQDSVAPPTISSSSKNEEVSANAEGVNSALVGNPSSNSEAQTSESGTDHQPSQVDANTTHMQMQPMMQMPVMQPGQNPMEYYQQMQQYQAMQAAVTQGQNAQGSPASMQAMMIPPMMGQFPQYPQYPGQVMPGVPGVPGVPIPTNSPPVPEAQTNQTQQEHIPDATEIEAPKDITDKVKADMSNKDLGKLFIGGLNWETDEERLKQYFSQYGEVLELNVMRDNNTGKSRGFAFLTFASSSSVDAVMKEKHILDGKLIDPKRAIPKDEQEKVGKVFVGGIAADVTPEEFRSFFEKFGTIIDSQLMINKDTGKSRGYGFVTYDSQEAVDRVTKYNYVMFRGKKMEIKKAEPRTQHLKNQGRSVDNTSYNQNNQYGSPMGGPMGFNAGAPGGFNNMQYWQQMQQMQQMQQYWMQMQQQQQQQQHQPQQHMSPTSQDAQLNMYSSNNGNQGQGGDDDNVPNPQEHGSYNDGNDDYRDDYRDDRRGGYNRRDDRRGGRRYDDDDDEFDGEDDRTNLPSGPKKLRERRGSGSGGSRYNDRRSGGGGSGGGGSRRRGGRSGRRNNNYHPYRR